MKNNVFVITVLLACELMNCDWSVYQILASFSLIAWAVASDI